MLVVRAICEQDIDKLMALVDQVGLGMTTLKADRKMLGHRVEIACASFAQQVDVRQRDYMFVMEDTGSQALVGICAVKSVVGLDEPFYNYRIGTLVHSSKELQVFSRMETLYLSNDLMGTAELCSLFLHPAYRTGSNGKLLSKSRFLFIAQFPHLFPEKIIAEMRGYLRADGVSPFWDNLGRHFFMMDFNRADDLTGLGKKAFIAELMPRHPLYVAYLPQEAQDAIGRVHTDTVPARRMLEQEGMYYEGYVDIFDAGPVLQARVRELRAMRDSGLMTIAPESAGKNGGAEEHNEPLLVSNTSLKDFRVIATPSYRFAGPDMIALPENVRMLLCPESEDRVRSMILNPGAASR